MEREKIIDEKTARLIDEMEKSLQNMERSLGPDHLVLAKTLDSYAKLLKQNNLRPIDALNLEARAKAIRAKHNQRESQQQSLGLGPIVREKKLLETGQLRALVWVISALVLLGIVMSVSALMKSGLRHGQTTVIVNEAKEDLQSTVSEERDPDTGELISKTTVTGSVSQPAARSMTIFEIAAQLMKIKNLAKEKLPVGLKAEKERNFEAASAAYLSVIQAEDNAARNLGRQAHSEEIAQCYEGYARMLELDAQMETAKQYEKTAASIRAQLK